jgi:hypothetical protein
VVVTVNIGSEDNQILLEVHGDYEKPDSGDYETPPTHGIFTIEDVFYEDVSIFNLLKCIEFNWEALEEKVIDRL